MPGILPYLGRSTQPPRSRFHHEIWARSHFSPISIIAVGIEWCPNLRTSSARSREHSQVGTGPPWQLLDRPPGAGVPCQRREPLMRRWYGSGREGLVELFDANADVGVADVVKQRGELRLADSPAGLLQPLDRP